jgi:putative hemolysin
MHVQARCPIEGVFSAALLARENLDHVPGAVQAKDLLAHTLTDQRVDLHSTFEEPLYVPESMQPSKSSSALSNPAPTPCARSTNTAHSRGWSFRPTSSKPSWERWRRLGSPLSPHAVQREDGSWLVDGMMPVDEFKDLLRTGPLPDEEQRVYQTVAGFVMLQLGRIPAPSDHVAWGEWRLEVVDMDGRRIDTLLVTPVPSSAADGKAEPEVA